MRVVSPCSICSRANKSERFTVHARPQQPLTLSGLLSMIYNDADHRHPSPTVRNTLWIDLRS